MFAFICRFFPKVAKSEFFVEACKRKRENVIRINSDFLRSLRSAMKTTLFWFLFLAFRVGLMRSMFRPQRSETAYLSKIVRFMERWNAGNAELESLSGKRNQPSPMRFGERDIYTDSAERWGQAAQFPAESFWIRGPVFAFAV